MTAYPYGKTIVRDYYPVRDVGGFAEPYALYSTTASIYLFDEKPSRDAAQSGTGSLSSAVGWHVTSTTPYACTYSFTAIDDPNPTSSEASERYWEALNIYLENGEQVQTVLRSFLVERAIGLPEVPGTTVSTIKEAFPAIEAYLSDAELEDMLAMVEEQVKIDLLGNNIRWANVYNLRALKLALAYRAIMLASISQIRNAGDRHDRRYSLFQGMYDATMKSLILYQDTDADGAPDTATGAQPTHYIIQK